MWKEVDKDQFEEFIKSYPNEITANTNAIFEPPQREFYDFSIEHKESVYHSKIAYYYDDWAENNKRHYFLKEKR